MDIFSNPWVIGVGGGIISGLLVTLITRYLFSRRERREYQQKIETANNEIIYALRPTIAEKVIPTDSMLDALFSATARKYGANETDLYSKVGLANELIKEVMDNTFLSSQQKIEFCDLLSTLKKKNDKSTSESKTEIITITKRDSFDPSFLLGLTTAMMALVLTLYSYVKDKDSFLLEGLTDKLFPMIAVLAVIPILAFMTLEMFKRVKDVESIVRERKASRDSAKNQAESTVDSDENKA